MASLLSRCPLDSCPIDLCVQADYGSLSMPAYRTRQRTSLTENWTVSQDKDSENKNIKYSFCSLSDLQHKIDLPQFWDTWFQWPRGQQNSLGTKVCKLSQKTHRNCKNCNRHVCQIHCLRHVHLNSTLLYGTVECSIPLGVTRTRISGQTYAGRDVY